MEGRCKVIISVLVRHTGHAQGVKAAVKCRHGNAVSYSMRRTWSAQVLLVVLRVHGSCVWFPLNAQLSGKFVIARL